MDITPLLERLRAVSNDELHAALRSAGLVISNEKFQTAFLCVAASHNVKKDDVDFNGPPNIRKEVIRNHPRRASIVFMTFSTLCFMRSDHLERGLDAVPKDSTLRAFRDIYRSGKKQLGEDTLVQHIRNSITHGTFRFEGTLEIVFTDKTWEETLPISQLKELCEHVHRFYHEAVPGGFPRPPHWSKYGQ